VYTRPPPELKVSQPLAEHRLQCLLGPGHMKEAQAIAAKPETTA